MKPHFTIFAASDATGELAHNLAVAASRQFEDIHVKIVRKGRLILSKIPVLVEEVKMKHGVILFTMVSNELRQALLTEAKKEGVVAIDIMGPALGMLANYFHKLPSNEPGLQYKVTQDYYKRTEAIDFSVRHDEGLGLDTLDQADIILLGISRTSKTPLSVYLAYHGYRSANLPIIPGVPIPDKLVEMDRKKMVGLTRSTEDLASHRSTRLKKMGRPESEQYAQKEHIEKELAYANEVFQKLGVPLVIDVGGKATEEIASEIILAMGI